MKVERPWPRFDATCASAGSSQSERQDICQPVSHPSRSGVSHHDCMVQFVYCIIGLHIGGLVSCAMLANVLVCNQERTAAVSQTLAVEVCVVGEEGVLL